MKCKCIGDHNMFVIGKLYKFEDLKDSKILYIEPEPDDLFSMSVKLSNRMFYQAFIDISEHRNEIIDKILV